MEKTKKLLDSLTSSEFEEFTKSEIEISDKFNQNLRDAITNIPDKKEETPILRSVPTFQNLK